MKIAHSFDEIPFDPGSRVTVGTFDGVHRAHREIILELVKRAHENGGRAVVVTFDPHPKEIAASARGPVQLLTTLAERQHQMQELGVDVLVVVAFTYEFSRMSAREFYAQNVVRRIGVKEVVVGYDHMFGRDREAGIGALEDLGREFGFTVAKVAPRSADGEVVSSTRIRRALTAGQVEHARALLGYPYPLSGIVVEGDRRGRTLGFPTANLQPDHLKKIVPARGVYVVRGALTSGTFTGIMNIGYRPTVTETHRLILEVHLLDFAEEIYGERMNVSFLSRLRDEKKFGSLSELISQLHQDRDAARRFVEIDAGLSIIRS
jgi:riboflavin kinase / FMN adenylyltransferase